MRVAVFTLTPLSILYELYSPQPQTDFGSFGMAGGTDLSGDGIPDLAVTDSTYSQPFLNAGAIHAFNGVDGSLLWTVTGGGTVEDLGYGVACPGDLDGDGNGDVIASSLQYGATVHVLSGLDGREMYQLVGLNPYYGKGVANASGCGDADGDGLPDILLGANEISGLHKGTAFVHRGYDGALIHQWEGPRKDEKFGLVFGPGDVNGDGWPDFAVCAREHHSAQGARGGIYLYSGRDLEPLALLESPAPVAEVFQFAGIQRSYTMGDANGDGRMDILTSDPWEDPGMVDGAGTVYVFTFDPFLTTSARQLSAAGGGTMQLQLDFPATEAGFGYRLLASDDLPGSLTVHGVKIPLVWTALLQKFVNNPPPVFDYPTGTLDANGDALVTATIPANALAAYIGRTVKFAAVSLLTPSQPSLSSAAAWVEVLP